jgi:hypothetical protein
MFRTLTNCLLAIALVATGAAADAQPLQTGTVSGTIQDATGSVLPGVTVTLTSRERGFSRDTVSDENGRFVFPAVPIGRYDLVATLQGFETAQAVDNLVEQDKTTNVPIALKIGQLTDTVEVLGTVPIVDPTTATVNTRVRREEFEKLPVGRSYQALISTAPGIVNATTAAGTTAGNPNALGALSSNNVYIVDAVDTTDPTTGTFGTNLNFESIEEVSVMTSGISAEYGRAQGAVINVVTKSGTNRFEGSAKYIMTNDNWNADNKTASEVTGASLNRVKFDQVNPVWTFTGGGPIWRNRAWFFGGFEHTENTTPQRQTVGPIPEDYQQVTENNFGTIRGTVQVAEGHTAWVKYYKSPTDGFVIDYWGGAAERESLTAQNQSSKNWAAQWSGVIRGNWAMEAAFADYGSLITVTTFEEAGRLANAPIYNFADELFYNGATFDGFVDRPRQQFNVASNWFLTPGGRSHNLKVGFDFQNMESGAEFKYPNGQLYYYESYNQGTNSGVPLARLDYETGPSISSGKIYTLYARDKFEVGARLALEAGLRWEKQTGSSDLGVATVDTNVVAPRFSGTYDLDGEGRTLIVGSAGRFYSSIIQGFSDSFAGIPQQENYDLFEWNGSAFVFAESVRVGGSDFQPNIDLKPYHMDEFTIGFQRQFGRNMGAGVRFIAREWGDFLEDIRTFRPDGSIQREVVNYDVAERNFRGVQLTLERRFSNNWHAQGSYTYSRTRGNYFDDDGFSPLGDFLDATCVTTTDLTIGSNGRIPCAEVQNGANKFGYASYDRPHNLKLNGSYLRPIGPVNLVFSALTEFSSKQRFERQRTLNVINPVTGANSGQTATYFYEERGASPVEGLTNYIDFGTEATWRIAGSHQAGAKIEIFNVTNNQEKWQFSNVAWCGAAANATCQTAIDNFGKASARGHFYTPRAFRFSFIYRF